MVAHQPLVAERLQLLAAHADIQYLVLCEQPFRELLARLNGFALGDVVADIAWQQLQQVMREGAEQPFDMRFMPRLERRAFDLLNVQCAEHVVDVDADVFLAIVGFGLGAFAPVQQRGPDQDAHAQGAAGFGNQQLGAAAPDVDDAEQAVTAIRQHQIGRGGVELPALVQAENVFRCRAERRHVLVFPRVRVD